MNAREVIVATIREHDRRCNQASADYEWNQSAERYKQRKAPRELRWPPPLDEMIDSALRAACGGGDVVIRTDGTLATLDEHVHRAEIDSMIAALGGIYTHEPDPRIDLPLAEQVDLLIKWACSPSPDRFRRSIPNDPRDHDHLILGALRKLVAMLDASSVVPVGGERP